MALLARHAEAQDASLGISGRTDGDGGGGHQRRDARLGHAGGPDPGRQRPGLCHRPPARHRPRGAVDERHEDVCLGRTRSRARRARQFVRSSLPDVPMGGLLGFAGPDLHLHHRRAHGTGRRAAGRSAGHPDGDHRGRGRGRARNLLQSRRRGLPGIRTALREPAPRRHRAAGL